MTSVIDLWRAVDPEARRISGSLEALARPARGVLRTRAMAPHLPPTVDGEVLVVDAPLAAGAPLDVLLSALSAAELRPVAIVVAGLGAGLDSAHRLEPASDETPVLLSARPIGPLVDRLAAYLRDEEGHLARLAADLRLAAAEAALADPDPAAPAGLIAARTGRGVAVVVDGEMRALHARRAGRALAARFAAAHARLLGASQRHESSRRMRDGLWLLERRVRAGATVWLFDDLPFARVDGVAADALGVTLRALLRRVPAPRSTARPASRAAARPSSSTAETNPDRRFSATLLAVARSNGRIAPAARSLGVHRNTVLYRLRVARAEYGIDPRRPEDALRILADAEVSTG